MKPKYRLCYYLHFNTKHQDTDVYSFRWAITRWFERTTNDGDFNDTATALRFIVSTFRSKND